MGSVSFTVNEWRVQVLCTDRRPSWRGWFDCRAHPPRDSTRLAPFRFLLPAGSRVIGHPLTLRGLFTDLGDIWDRCYSWGDSSQVSNAEVRSRRHRNWLNAGRCRPASKAAWSVFRVLASPQIDVDDRRTVLRLLAEMHTGQDYAVVRNVAGSIELLHRLSYTR